MWRTQQFLFHEIAAFPISHRGRRAGAGHPDVHKRTFQSKEPAGHTALGWVSTFPNYSYDLGYSLLKGGYCLLNTQRKKSVFVNNNVFF